MSNILRRRVSKLKKTLKSYIVRLNTAGSSRWTVPANVYLLDLFLVGGGGGGGLSTGGWTGAGGGGGYTNTVLRIKVTPGQTISYTIGAGGGANGAGGSTSCLGYTASGGGGGGTQSGGAGGSGGGCGTYVAITNMAYCRGGSDGDTGTNLNGTPVIAGQGTTTREFGESNGLIHAGGGSGGNRNTSSIPGGSGQTINKGSNGASGGSGSGGSGGNGYGGGGGGGGYACAGGAGGAGGIVIRYYI